MKRFVIDFAKAIGWLILIVPGGLTVIMIVAGMVGYLPYSDRLGPGWYGAHLPSWEEVSFYFGFAVFFAYYFVFWGPLLFVFARIVSWLGSPRWLLRTLAGITGGFLCLILANAAGWYVAISAFAVYAAGVLGVVYGALVLPRFTGEAKPDISPLLRWIAIPTLFVLFVGALAYPLIPARDAQSLDINVLTLERGQQSIAEDAPALGLSDQQIFFLESAGVRGKLHGSSQFSYSIGDDSKKAKAIVILTHSSQEAIHLQQPKATTVLYLQAESQWLRFPRDAAFLKKKFTITPGKDTGAQIQID